MKNFSTNGPAFFKFLHMIGDFIPKLCIPPSFTEKYGEFLPSKATLEMYQSGKSWDVRIEEMQGDYWLTDGWVEFVVENNINCPDLLVFQLVSNSGIVIQIFDKNGYKRNVQTHVPQQENPRIEVVISSSEESGINFASVHEEGDSRGQGCNDVVPIDDFHTNLDTNFTFTWKKSMKNCMHIKGSICKKIGLTKKRTLKLKNLGGEIHDISVFKTGDGRVSLGWGWSAFIDASHFVSGQTYQFEFFQNGKDEVLLQLSLM